MNQMELITIKERLEENEDLIRIPFLRESVEMTVEFYKKVGFVPPWIGYCAVLNDKLVGLAGFKGPPINSSIEIAYGTNEQFRNQGIGEAICKALVSLVLKTDPSLRISARTLPEKNYSTRILLKNNFEFVGTVLDLDDGEVWEWVYKKNDETL